MSRFVHIDIETRDNVAVIRLNQPDRLNAISFDMAREAREAIEAAPQGARAIFLCGAGRAFCSGADLSSGGVDISDPMRDFGAGIEHSYNPLIRAMRDTPLPIVVGVRGAAAGIGCSVALMGDIIVAGKSAYFLQAFCNIGLVPDGGSPYLLARAAGRIRAMEMMLLGERYPAERAYADGLITRLVEDERVDDEAFALARRLAEGPTRTLALARKLAWAALDQALEEQLVMEREMQREAGRTEDAVEGVTAFLMKRKAAFKGR
jgi:2-(1,2-epoxy-1,2-dihydrophenyl)acetyl-CoA isomerase